MKEGRQRKSQQQIENSKSNSLQLAKEKKQNRATEGITQLTNTGNQFLNSSNMRNSEKWGNN